MLRDDPPRLRFHRLAEQVADHLRQRIISGDFADGALLPKSDDLLTAAPEPVGGPRRAAAPAPSR